MREYTYHVYPTATVDPDDEESLALLERLNKACKRSMRPVDDLNDDNWFTNDPFPD